MRPKAVKQLLKHQLEAGSDPGTEFGSTFLWGPPGIGKSRIVEDVAKEMGVGCIDFRLILCDPTDLRGLPIPIKDPSSGKTRCIWVPPDELPRDGAGFLFFDDFPTAPPLVQGSAYQIAIRPHQLGPYHLPEKWVVITAGNRIQDRALAHRISTALANRFRHVELDINIDDWVDWALQNGIDPNIVGFLKFRDNLLMQFDPDSSEHAFATPRTWEMASRTLALPKSIQVETLEGTVGKGATAEFMSFLKIQTELPDINSILNGQNKDYLPTRTDLKYALVSALASRATGTKQLDNCIQYSYKLPAEFGVLLVTMMVSKDEKAVIACPSIEKWAREHQGVILTKRVK